MDSNVPISLLVISAFVALDLWVNYFRAYSNKKETTSSSSKDKDSPESSEKKDAPQTPKEQETENKRYSPNFKIWGFGAILGAAYLFMHYLIIILKTLIPFGKTVKWHEIVLLADKPTDWMLVVLPLGILTFIIITIGLFLYSIVKISTED